MEAVPRMETGLSVMGVPFPGYILPQKCHRVCRSSMTSYGNVYPTPKGQLKLQQQQKI